MVDERPIRVDIDWGFQEGRQYGRGRSGGQVRGSRAVAAGQGQDCVVCGCTGCGCWHSVG